MKNIRIDADGTPRCWNCGSKGLTEKRTFRSKAAVGVGALLTKKKLKCQRCGEYNDTGNGQPYDGPKGRKYRKEWEKEQAERAAAGTPPPPSAPPPQPPSAAPEQSTASKLESLASLYTEGLLTEEEFADAKAKLLAGDD